MSCWLVAFDKPDLNKCVPERTLNRALAITECLNKAVS